MTTEKGTDPLDELRRANPAQSSPAPSDSAARIWARIEEATMDVTTTSRRRSRTLVGGMAAAGVAGVAALALLFNPGVSSPGPGGDPGTGIGSCVETYSLATLASRDHAFYGTVSGVDGDSVTFTVNESFVGGAAVGDSVTLTARGMSGSTVTSAGGLSLAVGSRYLVAGDDTFAWACGFTQPYDEAVAASWAQAAR